MSAVGDAVDVAAFVDVSTEVGGEAVLALSVVVKESAVLVTAVVADAVDVAALVDVTMLFEDVSTVVVGEAVLVLKVV